MTVLPILSAHKVKVIKALESAGFKVVSQKESHIKMKMKTPKKTFIVIIPNYNEIPVGTLRSFIRQSGLTPQEFLQLL
jgi:predicted RNA binding protein YcfA (HicA-like mRNA interferase family)